MANRIVLASGNPGKLRECQSLFAKSPWQILPQSAFGINDAEETGLTFVENALIKARQATSLTGLPAIADDSGLEVHALNNRPGIYSARYAGTGASDKDNIDKLLQQLEGVPMDQRKARFRCVIVYLASETDPVPVICEGCWEGQIAKSATGQDGFGYDPVFYIPALHRNAAELPVKQKNRWSHRARALRKLRARLLSQIQ